MLKERQERRRQERMEEEREWETDEERREEKIELKKALLLVSCNCGCKGKIREGCDLY